MQRWLYNMYFAHTLRNLSPVDYVLRLGLLARAMRALVRGGTLLISEEPIQGLLRLHGRGVRLPALDH